MYHPLIELLRHPDLLFLCLSLCASLISGAGDPQLEGTWTTKSRKVLTGPVRVCAWPRKPLPWGLDMPLRLTPSQGFYDPVNEKMFEPDLTGFSYSFTKDGFYESAYYRAVANRKPITRFPLPLHELTRCCSNQPILSSRHHPMATRQVRKKQQRLAQPLPHPRRRSATGIRSLQLQILALHPVVTI